MTSSRRRASKKSLASAASRESSGRVAPRSPAQSRHPRPGRAGTRREPAGGTTRADIGLQVLGAGLSASYGRGRKRKSAQQWPPQKQRRHRPNPATRPCPAGSRRQRRGGTRSPCRPSSAAPPGVQLSDGAATAAALRRGRPGLGLPAPADSCSGSNPACIRKWRTFTI